MENKTLFSFNYNLHPTKPYELLDGKITINENSLTVFEGDEIVKSVPLDNIAELITNMGALYHLFFADTTKRHNRHPYLL